MPTHLFAIGGGGYAGPQGGPNRMLLEILKTTGKKYPKICLIPTAGGDRAEGITEFMHCLSRMRAHPNFLSLYAVPTRDIEDYVMDFDAVFISGGNTKNLIALWRAWELDKILVRAWQKGVVISGGSAGANCWYEQSNSDFIPNEFNPLDGLGVLKGSFCPHYADEKGRRSTHLQLIKDGKLKAGYACSDRSALHYVDGVMKEALIEWDQAAAYWVECKNGEAVETKLPARTV